MFYPPGHDECGFCAGLPAAQVEYYCSAHAEDAKWAVLMVTVGADVVARDQAACAHPNLIGFYNQPVKVCADCRMQVISR